MKLKKYQIWQISISAIILIAALMASASAQYLDISIDPNKAFGIVDNPRTKVDHRGLDFDVELGAVNEDFNFGMYVFYGMFDQANYQNYGLGADYYFLNNENITVTAGAGGGMVLKRMFYEDVFRCWGSAMAWHARGNVVWWAFERVGVSFRGQYQRRPDISKKGILEGSFGVRYKF